MGLKLSNRQLKLLTELVLQASKDTPNVEFDEMLNRMMEMCRFRGMTINWNNNSAGDIHGMAELALKVKREQEPSMKPRENGSVRQTPEHVKREREKLVHPLMRDPS
jgi:hypothetical protein